MTKIIYYGGCSYSNMGNSFIDLGAMGAIKELFPKADLYFASEFNRWFANYQGDVVDCCEIIDADYLFVSGVCLDYTFTIREGKTLLNRRKDMKQIIFLGAGAGAEGFTPPLHNHLKKLKPDILVSRTPETYKTCKKYFKHSYNGIDMGFFLPRYYPKPELKLKDIVVLCNHKDEEIENRKNCTVIKSFHNLMDLKWGNAPEGKLLFSDNPLDYIWVYSNTKEIHSTKVHGCVPVLAYGGRARLYNAKNIGKRFGVFEAVGCGEIGEKLVSLNLNHIQEKQEEIIEFLRGHIE